MDALTFLDRGDKGKPLPLYVVHGDEAFLKREVISKLKTMVLAEDAGEASTYLGDKVEFAAVFDELETVGFFTTRRLVIVESADPFVTKYRAQLEKKLPSLAGPSVLVLDVKTWAANTKLAKLVNALSVIVAKAPAAYRLAAWVVEWTPARYQTQISMQAAEMLVNYVGIEMGILDQEIQKLCVYVGARAKIDVGDVDRLVGRSREENVWKIFDAIGEARAVEALGILEGLLDQGEEPLKILGAFSMQLRRLAQAARLTNLGRSLTTALEEVGVPPFGLKSAEKQLRHLGRRRAEKLYDWLLDVNLGLRGSSSLTPRALMEKFLIQLARPTT